MADLLALHSTLRAANTVLDSAQRDLNIAEAILENAVSGGDVQPTKLVALREQVAAKARIVASRTNDRDAAQSAYSDAVAADPMQAADATLPLVLLPVRIETAYLPSVGGTDLAIRVYPDDIHVDAHEPELTAAELSAGTSYWQAVWGAGPNTARLDAAWNAVLAKLKPLRGAWAVEVLTPAVARPADETPPDQEQPEPPLPVVATRPGTFTRAAHTTLLPDHWHFIGMRDNQELFNVVGSPIPDALDVSFGPPGVGATATDLPFDEGSRWLVELPAAIAAGMAVRITLPGPDFSIDQLFVLGVSAQLAPDDAANRLATTLVAHQYTNSLGFLPPGTPTNNTSASRSAWQSAPGVPTPPAADALRSLYQPTSLQNAAVVARVLGIDGTDALSVAPDGLTDQQSAISTLQQQLWPVFGEQALVKMFLQWDVPAGQDPMNGSWQLHNDPATVAAIQELAAGWVRSRGTLPVLRVGNQPYGLLPASSLADWAAPADDSMTALLPWLRLLRPYWLAAVLGVPSIVVSTDGQGQGPDKTVVDILSRQPVSDHIMVRADGDPWDQIISSQPLPVAPIPNLPVNSRLFLSAPADTAVPNPVAFVADPAVNQDLLKKWLVLYQDSLNLLEGNMTSADWSAAHIPGNTFEPFLSHCPDLFMALMRDSFIDPFAGDSAFNVFFFAVFVATEPEKVDANVQQKIQAILPFARAFVARFQDVVNVPNGSYETALREIMDVFSHRYDAWVTALAARRLDQMRAAKPTGVVIGAYGWVEDLAPRTDLTPVDPPPGFDTVLASPRQRYIHAPSLHHAATAAVLRAGFDSHSDSDALAVNLVSSRVRTADWLVEGVRNGQTLGALLGYHFERGLHDAGLDVLIEQLRKDHPLPLPAGPDGDVNGANAREAIAARNVVDGLDLYRNRDALKVAFAAQPQVGKLLDELADAVDSLGDLLLAESVHHLVGGNPLRAGLVADTIGRGESMPDRFDVVRTPRSGRPLTWQLGALLPASLRSAVAGWQSGRPRAILAPHIEAWTSAVLGAASQWQIVCTAALGADVTSVAIGLDTLGICAFDAVIEAAGEPSLLERRIVDAVAAGNPGSVVSVQRGAAADRSLGFVEFLGLAVRLRQLLAKAAPLGPQQVNSPDSSPGQGLDTDELDGRVQAFVNSFGDAVSNLSLAAQQLSAAAGADPATLQAFADDVRLALLALADHGIASAYPQPAGDDVQASATAIGAQASAVLAAVNPLAMAVPPSPPDANAPLPDVAKWLGAVTDFIQAIAGKAFPVLPTYQLASDSAYAASFAPAAQPAGADRPATMAWLRRMARVRPRVAALHDVLLAAESLTSSAPALTAAQFPAQAGVLWAGLPFADGAPPKTRVAVLLSTPAPIDPAIAFCGFSADTWTEQLPGLVAVANPTKGYEPAEITGVSFNVDAPDAYPPQTVLLAVAPDPAAGWSLDVLVDVLRETFEMAKIRGVDLGDLPRFGRVLPAIHSASNVDSILAKAGLKQ